MRNLRPRDVKGLAKAYAAKLVMKLGLVPYFMDLTGTQFLLLHSMCFLLHCLLCTGRSVYNERWLGICLDEWADISNCYYSSNTRNVQEFCEVSINSMSTCLLFSVRTLRQGWGETCQDSTDIMFFPLCIVTSVIFYLLSQKTEMSDFLIWLSIVFGKIIKLQIICVYPCNYIWLKREIGRWISYFL